jgi:molybdopterin converting factor small subunit
MKITAKIYADLRQYIDGEGTVFLELEKDAKVSDVLTNLNIPKEKVKIIMVNGRRATANIKIHDGDRVGIFPPIAGG